MRWFGVAPVVWLLVLASCGGGVDESSTEAPIRGLATVDTSTPEPLVVPGDPPKGLVPRTATVTEFSDAGRFRLFGSPEIVDSELGEQLVVGTYYDSGDAFGRCGDSTAAAVVCGDWIVAQRPIDQCNGDCVAVVLGKGSSAAHVAAVADSLTFDDEAQAIVRVDALPPGVVELVEAPLSIHRLTTPGAQLIEYREADGATLWVSAVSAGGELGELLRFFADDDGNAAPFSAWQTISSFLEVRVLDDTVVAVFAGGVDRSDVQQFAMSMHPDEGGEWDAFREATLEVSPRAILPDEAGQPFVAVVGDRLEDAQWAVGYQRYDDGKLYQEITISGPDPGVYSSGGGGNYELGPADEVAFVGGGRFGGGRLPGALFTGFAPVTTSSLVLEVDGVEFDAVVGEPADLPGGVRPWGIFINGEPSAISDVVTVVAFDETGVEIARTTTGA